MQITQTSLFDTSPNGQMTPSAAVVSQVATQVAVLEASAVEANRQENSYSLKIHRDLFIRLGAGAATLDEYQDGFRRLVLNEEGIKAELSQLKKDEVLKLLSGVSAYRYKSEKKDNCVRAACHAMVVRFVLHRGLTYMGGENVNDVVAKMVAATTEKDLLDYAAEITKAREEYRERAMNFVKAMKDPETLEEFEVFIRHKGDAALTSAQRTKYDELVAQTNRAKVVQDQEEKAVAQPVEGVAADMTIIEAVHTNKQIPIWTVKLSDRVERNVYLDLNKRAKKLGGYYSKFRGNGAVPGFIFEEKEAAEKFVANDQVSVVDKAEARKDEKQQAAAQRLKDMAEKLEAKGSEQLSRDRQVNTGRRARMAASAEAKASAEIALAKTMRNLAEAIESGQAVHLGGLRTKAQVEMLITLSERAKHDRIGKEDPSYLYYEKQRHRDLSTEDIDFAKWPDYSTDKSQLVRCANSLAEVVGGKGLSDDIGKKAAAMDADSRINIDRHVAEKIMDKLENKSGYGILGWWDSARENLKRLDSMGITELPMLRAALREFVQFRSHGPKVNRAKELERQLVGCKIPGFFPTPRPAVDRVIELACIEAGMEVCDPEAGSGNISERIRATCPEAVLSVIEINSTLREILKEKGFNIVGQDFLDHRGEYDRILMNPPFDEDMEHIQHAYSLLRPRGRVVSICSEGPFFRNDKQSVAFRAWLDEVGGTTEDLESGTFMDRTQIRTTTVKSRIVVANKQS